MTGPRSTKIGATVWSRRPLPGRGVSRALLGPSRVLLGQAASFWDRPTSSPSHSSHGAQRSSGAIPPSACSKTRESGAAQDHTVRMRRAAGGGALSSLASKEGEEEDLPELADDSDSEVEDGIPSPANECEADDGHCPEDSAPFLPSAPFVGSTLNPPAGGLLATLAGGGAVASFAQTPPDPKALLRIKSRAVTAIFGDQRAALMATSADLFAKDRSAILLDFRLARTCERNKVELSAHNRLPFMPWAWCVDWAIASHFDPKVAAELITRATPFLLADPNDFANTDPDFAHIRMLMVRANRDLEEDAAASAATAFALPIAHARIQESRNLMLRYFNARARLVHLLRDLASTSEFYGEAMLIAHACEYQAVSLRTFLHTLSVGICDAAAVSADGRGNPYVNAA